MEKKSEGSFARKVRNRKFAIDNSWKNESSQFEETLFAQDITKQEESDKWTLLNENLAEANESKFYDGYPTISSNGKCFGKVKVFVKRAIRKVIKHTLGWYIFPFYQRFSHFAGKMVNVVSLERDYIYAQQEQINRFSITLGDLMKQINATNEKIHLLSDEMAEKNVYLYEEICSMKQKEKETSDRLRVLEEGQKILIHLCEEYKEREERVTTSISNISEKLEQQIFENANRYERIKEQFCETRQNGLQLNDEISLIKKLLVSKEKQLNDTVLEVQNQMVVVKESVNEQVESLRETDLWLNNEMLENRKKVDAHEAYISNETWMEDDNFYHDFEEYFRGERALIKQRQEQYVPFIKSQLQDWSKCTFVDIGSGRGEWLDILKENGATNYIGIDLNERQNQISRSFGHKVLNENGVIYLSGLQDNSVDVISGFQVIEHLSRKELQEVFKQCNRVLKRGGMILFETPNPQNVEVGANTFYLDPTHIKPLNPLYVQYLAERNGFEKVQIIYSSSNFDYEQISEEDKTVFSEQLTDRVLGAVNMLYGPKDFCILAIKG